MSEAGIYQYERHRASREYFSPGPFSMERTATTRSAVFNLVSTIIGGGVLSLPYTFSKCGLVLAVIFLTIAAAISNFTLYIIVSSSRRGAATTFEEIVRKALGTWAGLFAVLLLIILTLLSMTAYTVLIKDLVTSLAATFYFHRALSLSETNLLTIAVISLISPVLLAKSMNALRYTSVFSSVSVLTLAIIITIRATQAQHDPSAAALDAAAGGIKWWPTSWKDPIYAFPIMCVSFLCHFNVLPVYHELQDPTRRRLKNIVFLTTTYAWVFYMTVGFAGYFFAFRLPGGVKDDILNNFSGSDRLVNIGRMCLIVTLLMSMPLNMQPCRMNMLRLSTYATGFGKWKGSPGELKMLTTPTITVDRAMRSGAHEKTQRVVLTASILLVVVSMALTLPGVAVVWNIMGSTVGLLVSYVLPSASYAIIRSSKPHTDPRRFAAWFIFGFGLIACVVCSAQAIISVIRRV